jgi:hypothetical protein
LQYEKNIAPANAPAIPTSVGAPGALSAGELLRSANAVYWGLLRLALREFGGTLLPGSSGPDTIAGSEALGQIQLQMEAMARAVFTLNAFTPRYVMKTVLHLTLQSIGLFTRIAPGHECWSAWQEVHNKLQAFYLFEHVDSALDIVSDRSFSLPDLVQALNLDPYLSVWAAEGLGHYYTDLALRRETIPRGLLQDGVARDLPNSSIAPLHAGMGLSLAEFLLSRASNCQIAIDSFIEACANNARDGYLGVTYEALGLVARNLYPYLLDPIHKYLSQYHEAVVPYFWHGVGRAIYFSPSNFLPYRSAPWAGMQMCVDESPDSVARRNALAGFTWAMTLVNIRHPEIMVLFLKHHGSNMPEPDAFIQGVYSSVIVWRDSAPQDTYIEALCRYQPSGSDPLLADLWNQYVRQPCRQAMHDYRALSDAGRIGTVFHF